MAIKEHAKEIINNQNIKRSKAATHVRKKDTENQR